LRPVGVVVVVVLRGPAERGVREGDRVEWLRLDGVRAEGEELGVAEVAAIRLDAADRAEDVPRDADVRLAPPRERPPAGDSAAS